MAPKPKPNPKPPKVPLSPTSAAEKAKAEEAKRLSDLRYQIEGNLRKQSPINITAYDQTRTFTQVDVSGAGYRCLWRAIALSYYGHEDQWIRVNRRAQDIYNAAVSNKAEHIGSPLQSARRQLYEAIAADAKTFSKDLKTGEWGDIDHIQIIADALDVEIICYTPTNVETDIQWGISVRGNRQPPARQIHISNYQESEHWTLLTPTDIVDENVVDDMDWHLNVDDVFRRPFRAAADPDRIPRFAPLHPRYNQSGLIPADLHHLANDESFEKAAKREKDKKSKPEGKKDPFPPLADKSVMDALRQMKDEVVTWADKRADAAAKRKAKQEAAAKLKAEAKEKQKAEAAAKKLTAQEAAKEAKKEAAAKAKADKEIATARAKVEDLERRLAEAKKKESEAKAKDKKKDKKGKKGAKVSSPKPKSAFDDCCLPSSTKANSPTAKTRVKIPSHVKSASAIPKQVQASKSPQTRAQKRKSDVEEEESPKRQKL